MSQPMSWPAPGFIPECYWAVIDAPGWRRPGQVPRHFALMLEELIPFPADQLHAVGVPLGDGRAVVCAVPRASLADVPSGLPSLTPSTIPEAVTRAAGIELDVGRFNLLVGEFEPVQQRTSRRRRVVVAAAAVLAFCGLLAIGFERRAAHWRAVDKAAQQAAVTLRAKLDLPQEAGGVELVSASVEGLRAVRRAVADAKPSPDAALALAELFRGWPASDASETQSINITGGVVTVSTAVRGDPRRFLDALRVPAGWSLDEPRLNNAGELTRLTLTLRRAAGSGGGAGSAGGEVSQ